MDFYDLIQRRRMVRAFTDAALDPAAVERILDAARRGPSAGYSQGVEFIVVTDAEAKQRIGALPEALQRAGVPSFVDRAPVVIVVCTSAEIYTSRYREGDKARLREGIDDDDFWHVPYWHTDAGAAMMLILLAAVNEGLGAGAAGVMRRAGQERIREALGMPPEYTAVAMIALGHEAPEARKLRGSAATRKRRPLDDVVHREHW